MVRPVKYALIMIVLALIVGVSFAGGKHLRRVAAGPIPANARISSLPESGIGMREKTTVLEQGGDTNPQETFQEVYRYIKSDYVDRIGDDRKLGFGAVRSMLLSLDDPRTRFLEPAEYQRLKQQIEGQFTGIGAVLTIVKQKSGSIEKRRLGVVAPAYGGPADRAGVRPGDIITEIDGRWIIAYDPRLELDRINYESDDKEYRKALKDARKKLEDGITVSRALDLLMAKDGKTLVLTLERPGSSAPVKVTVTTASTTVEPVEFKAISEQVGYLRVTQFNDRATAAFTAALKSARQKAIVVDLRNNAGGPVTTESGGVYKSALSLLGLLTKGGQMGTLLKKGNRKVPIEIAASGGGARKIAVLINGGTSNIAEWVASALKERAGAKLIGARTFGDAIYQRFVPLREGAGMTVTAGKFLTAKGLDFTGKGIRPDVALATDGPRSSADPAVERAASVLAGA